MTTQLSVAGALGAAQNTGERISVRGWLRAARHSKAGISFLQVNDGSCFDSLQVVVPNTLANYEEVTHLSVGSAVFAMGRLEESQGRGQNVEIQADAVQIVGTVHDPTTYPISKKRHTFEYLRSVAHLRPRTNTFSAMTRLRHRVAQIVHQFFDNNGFFWVNTPIITASDTEGAGELFRVSSFDLAAAKARTYEDDFFGRETYLTVSGQLNVEAYCLAMTKTYTFGPTFRAENSNTSRHLAEFWMIEPEIAFADLSDNADLAESFLKSLFTNICNSSDDDLAFFEQRIDPDCINRMQEVTSKEFVRIDYSDAIDTLAKSKKKFAFPVSWGIDLQSEHERFLTEDVHKAPVIVMNYPAETKPFYMRLNDDGKTVAAMDVLVPGVGEIIGGSQREERLEQLESRMSPAMLDELWWYRDLRRYGTAPHAGFGAGFERLLLYMTGMENIRDVIPFPRVPKNARF